MIEFAHASQVCISHDFSPGVTTSSKTFLNFEKFEKHKKDPFDEMNLKSNKTTRKL